jgi:hypothetical protein
MIWLTIDRDKYDLSTLWNQYADAGYSNSGYLGFKAYVKAMVPEAYVTGTTKEGLRLKFAKESDATMYLLKYA